MRTLLSVVALALVFALGSNAFAEDAKPVKGKVTAVAKDSANDKLTDITITPHAKKGEAASADIVIKADDSTKVTKATKGKDSEAGTLADVVVGSYVTVTAGDEGKPAVAIEVHAPHVKKPASATN